VTDPPGTEEIPAQPATAESEEAKPYRECRHLLPVRGGSLACTAPAGHPTKVHYDQEFTLPDGRLAAWECRCSLDGSGTPSGCRTFVGYHDTETGTTTDPYAEAKDADT
jgi:hypothetical protein